jgi:hypothetical protein
MAAERWTGRLVHRGLPRSPADAGAPRPLARRDPLAGPVAITEHCVIGDQIRVPAARCDMADCETRFADLGALGEADNRARALGAGWRADAVGRLLCPACQQRNGATWARAPGHEPAAAGGPAPTGASPGLRGGVSRWARALLARWRGAASLGRHRRAQWLRLLAELASDSNGWDTPQPVTVPGPNREHPH